MQRLKCSVVIRCYNEERHIGRLLSGLMQQDHSDLEIVVVDSGSTDATLDLAQRFPVRIVHIAQKEFSFGRSLNRGFAACDGDVVVCSSAHVYPTRKDWVRQLIEPMTEDSVALTYGKQRGDERSKFSEQRLFEAWFPDSSERSNDYPFCNNANSAIRKTEWARHPFDEDLTGLEDIDWAKRAVARGKKIVYVPWAEVIHVHEETPLRIFRRYEREAIALRNIYPEQHFYLFDLLHLLPKNVAHDVVAGMRGGRPLSVVSEIVVFRAMQFLGTFSGFHQRNRTADKLKSTFYYPGTPSVSGGEPSSGDDMRIVYSQGSLPVPPDQQELHDPS